jgi:hypothetical protein
LAAETIPQTIACFSLSSPESRWGRLRRIFGFWKQPTEIPLYFWKGKNLQKLNFFSEREFHSRKNIFKTERTQSFA